MQSPRWLALALVVLAVSATASADAPPSWRTALAELNHLHELWPYALSIAGAQRKIEAQIAVRERALTAQIDALPDDSPELAAAVCELYAQDAQHGVLDRGATEQRLKRAIAAETRRNRPLAERYATLRGAYVSLPVTWEARGDHLDHDDSDVILGGPADHACADADLGHLRVLLAELYAEEKIYPNDVTGKPWPGRPTTKRHQADAAVHEIDAMYRELIAADADDPAAATLVELASVEFCTGPRAAVCLPRLRAAAKVVAIRARALPADDPMLAEARLAYARLLAGTAQPAQGSIVGSQPAKASPAPSRAAAADAERLLRQVVTDAKPGAPARLHAALDLDAMLRARHDSAGMRSLEADLLISLARPAHDEQWAWSAVGEAAAQMAHEDGRDGDAAALIAATITGFAAPELQGGVHELLEHQAGYDVAHATALRQQANRIQGDELQHARQLEAELRRLLPTW